MLIGPKYKICRRLGSGLFSKCQTTRYAVSEGKKKPNFGQARKHRSVRTEYGNQLMEKQKLRLSYGVNERQLVNYVLKSKRKRGVLPTNEVFRMLEMRLDNVVYRAGLVPTRRFAIQTITHGHILVNGVKVSSPSYELNPGDVVTLRTASKQKGPFRDRSEFLKDYIPPDWISFNKELIVATINNNPIKQEQSPDINLSSIVQFYSRV